MKKVKFHFVLEAKGSLENVYFHPENETATIVLYTDDDRKKWENESFEVMVSNPFEYKLVVFGVTGTEWKASLKIVNADGTESAFLAWDGKTGDTRRNISERTKPEKDV